MVVLEEVGLLGFSLEAFVKPLLCICQCMAEVVLGAASWNR